ncbi:type VI secretion system protein TssA [Pyxidicoccus sp. MSG2]|uniref:type VI secretion system protein TssA n=1 Tax=Pyxidicoccus sp. MSG2 TaxID=2996790 RepID=UPI00226DF97F|nr:type VI secretion system protein TssA [Pyxidicoccus sp. MSG2]MCY1021793.1 type VI secretion system protein TssA [Pyxidicoccus sp. MSG2]
MPPTLEELRERARPWVEPVPGTVPAGVQAKHEPAYEAITTEVAKLESPAAAGVRWDDVVQGAGDLLKGTTKDLWLASYMAYGLYATRGLDGAATGAAIITEVTERYWPDLFPELKRLRGRANAVGWFVERLGRMLPSVEQASVSAESLEALSVALKRLSQLSRERFADSAPAFGPLQDAISRLRAGLPPPAPAPAPQDSAQSDASTAQDSPANGASASDDSRSTTPVNGAGPTAASHAAANGAGPTAASRAATNGAASPPATAKTAAGSPATQAAPARNTVAPSTPVAVPALPALPASPDLSTAEAVTDFLRNVGTALLGAAGALRRASVADPLPYRLMRMGLWLHLARPPTAGANGRTPLQPLPDALRTKLETLENNQRWADLLDEAESALGQHRFALGLHRFSAAALTGLGESHAAAHAALVQELGAQLRRMPGVEELVAANGKPLTDDATRTWLRAQVILTSTSSATASAGPVASASPLALPPPSLPPEASAAGSSPALEDEARALLAEGRVHEAVTRLQGAIVAATTGRARFLSRLALARLCANAGQLPLARAVYDALDEEVSAHSLDTWEPALAAACLEGWLSTRAPGEKEGGRVAAKIRNRYRRLARLDSSAALRVGA